MQVLSRFPRFLLFLFSQLNTCIYRLVRNVVAQFLFLDALRSTHQHPPRLGKAVFIPRNHRALVVGEHVDIKDGAVFDIGPFKADRPPSTIVLGHHTVVGRNVRMTSLPGRTLRVGNYTTLQSGCQLVGDVSIGQFCLFSPNILISSGGHHFSHKPSWLIRAQDFDLSSAPVPSQPLSRPIVIEEDCWIGYGVVVNGGVTIGKGAVIGANAVVTRDVPPYSVQAGMPAREIGSRLNFQPPEKIEAAIDTDWPYFYAGFRHHRVDLQRTLKQGQIEALDHVRLVLKKTGARMLRLRGSVSPDRKDVNLEIRVNNVTVARTTLSGAFDARIPWERGAFRPATDDEALNVELMTGEVGPLSWRSPYALSFAGLET